ncbi:unnamed protein product [Effrenium voratum]|nr:unnamed protein product [Effrenium voratum]
MSKMTQVDDRSKEPYKAEPEDLIDQHVAYFLRKNPQAATLHSCLSVGSCQVRPRHKIQRRYLLDSRDVQIEWQYATEPGGQGFLVVVDGPLRQPFSDYMMDTEENATYDGQDIVQSNLHLIARDRRISFNDTHKVYNRLEAMKVAKARLSMGPAESHEQALVREKAASYVKDGRDVPQDLMALNYAMAMGAEISSNSWGGHSESPAMQSAIQVAMEEGHLFVSAAGNDNNNADQYPFYPCVYPHVLCVAASNQEDQFTFFTNYGVESVELVAPGQDIVSTYLGNMQYSSLTGTSFGTSIVAGAAALLFSWLRTATSTVKTVEVWTKRQGSVSNESRIVQGQQGTLQPIE